MPGGFQSSRGRERLGPGRQARPRRAELGLGRGSCAERLFGRGIREQRSTAPKASGRRLKVLRPRWQSPGPYCKSQTLPPAFPAVTWSLAHTRPAAQGRYWGPSPSLSNTFVAFLRSCTDEVSEQSSVPRSDSLEGFRCCPRCFASPSLRCCQLPGSCPQRSRELHSHPPNRGRGLPRSLRNPRAGRGGAFRGAELRRARAGERGEVRGRKSPAANFPFPLQFQKEMALTLYFPMLLEKVAFDLRSLFLSYSQT